MCLIDCAIRIIRHVIREGATNKCDKTRIALQYVQESQRGDGSPYLVRVDKHGPDNGWSSINPVSMDDDDIVRMVLGSSMTFDDDRPVRIEIQWRADDLVDPVAIYFEMAKITFVLEISGEDDMPCIEFVDFVNDNQKYDIDDDIMLLHGVDSKHESRLLRRLIR